MQNKKFDLKALLLLRPGKGEVNSAIWRSKGWGAAAGGANEWALPGLLSGLAIIAVLGPLLHFYPNINTAVLAVIALGILFIIHVSVMFYRNRR